MCALERTFDSLDRARERALLVAEQSALDETFRQRGAIQFDERPIASLALGVDRPREQLLTGPRLSFEQHGRTRRRGSGDCLEHATNRVAVADDLALVAELHDLAPQPLILASEANYFQRLVDRELQLLRAHRLRDVVDRPGLDRRNRMLDAAIPGEHDEGRLMPLLPQ